MGEPAPFGRAGEDILPPGMVLVQRVVETGDHSRGVAEGRMRGDVLDPLTINPHLAPVIEAVEELLAGIRQHGLGHVLPSPVRQRFSHGGYLYALSRQRSDFAVITAKCRLITT